MGGFVGPTETEGTEQVLDLESIEKLPAGAHPELFRPFPNPTPTTEEPLHAQIQYQIFVSEAEIRDRSKSNAIAKSITVVQTTWFIAQFIERWATGRPKTQLEVMTLAYVLGFSGMGS